MSVKNVGQLLTELNIDVAKGLFIIGADQVEDIPFDLTGTLLVTDLTGDVKLMTKLCDEMTKRFGANQCVELYAVSFEKRDSLGKVLPIGNLGSDGVIYIKNMNTQTSERMTWVLLRRFPTSERILYADKSDLKAQEGAETAQAYEFTLQPLIDVVAALRAPDGCPWDRLQTHSSLRRYLLEEVYEVLEAIDNQDMANLREELGDVLLQIVFHARLAEEQGLFTVQDIIDDITAKMIRRHPHVFAKATSKELAETQLNWEALKAQEPGHDKKTLLGGVSKGLPALLGAQKLQEKAAKVGFDWDTEPPVWAKFEEEIAEFKEAIAQKDYENAELEGGDVLFSLINLLRWYKIGGENALNRTNNKFRHRFAHVERCVKDSGKSWKDFSLEELDLFWESAKVSEQKHSLK